MDKYAFFMYNWIEEEGIFQNLSEVSRTMGV